MREYFTLPDSIPDYYAAGLRGDCGVQALLFITLCRCAGIPARWQSGLFVTPYAQGCHDWAQFYVAPYGWLFADCSFGGSAWRAGNAERHAFYFGNLDPFRAWRRTARCRRRSTRRKRSCASTRSTTSAARRNMRVRPCLNEVEASWQMLDIEKLD